MLIEDIINTNNEENINNNSSEFPKGMRVLAVDDDLVCLKLLTALLNKCNYQVTSIRNKREAVEVLKQNVEKFEIVLTDIYVDDIDGFKLVEVGHELNIPVIIISASENKDIIMKGVRFGVANYLIKPVSLQVIQTIWQYVYRNKLTTCSPPSIISDRVEGCRGGDHEMGQASLKEEGNPVFEVKIEEVQGEGESEMGEGSGSGSGSFKRKSPLDDDVEDNVSCDGDVVGNVVEKKTRFKWDKEPREKFMEVVEELGGLQKAVPKKILEKMGYENLTREQVASHLQKLRENVKRKADDQDASHSNNGTTTTTTNINTMTTTTNNNTTTNFRNYNNPRPFAPSSMVSMMVTTQNHQPLLPTNMTHGGLLDEVYHIQPSSSHRPQFEQQPTMIPNVGNCFGPSPYSTTMFQQHPQNVLFDSRLSPNTTIFQQHPQNVSFDPTLQPPQEVFGCGPSMIDTTYSSMIDDMALEFPIFDFREDDNKDQIHRIS